MEELIKAYEEYIEFLSEDISSNAVYLYVHGIECSDENIKKGNELRENIKRLKENKQ